MTRTYIRHKTSGHIFDRFPIREIWGVTLVTHDMKVLHLCWDSDRRDMVWTDITEDYDVVTHEVETVDEKEASKTKGCCRSGV